MPQTVKNQTSRGGLLTLRWLLPCLAMLALMPIARAEEDLLSRARAALAAGEVDAVAMAINALGAKPAGAVENAHTGLALFYVGRFDDAARHLRRAVVLQDDVLAQLKPLAELMPGEGALARLRELADKADTSAELCFLTGALLLVNGDRSQALPFLIRAEELAGTDAAVARLARQQQDRNRRRGESALQQGEWNEAFRAFAFAALDTPTAVENYAGMTIALGAAQELDLALRVFQGALQRRETEAMLRWVVALRLEQDEPVRLARELQTSDASSAAELRLAALLAAAGGHHATARLCAVGVLSVDRLDRFAREFVHFMEREGLANDPQRARAGEAGESALIQARRRLSRGDYEASLEALDPLVQEDAEADVFFLLYVALVGAGQLSEAGAALQAWLTRASEDKRARPVAEMFEEEQLFAAWHRRILERRGADPNAALPRLLNAYVELSRGNSETAHGDLVVARIADPHNPALAALQAMLDQQVQDEPEVLAPAAWKQRATQLFREGDYARALAALLRATEADRGLPGAEVALLRCYFALGEYEHAARHLLALLEHERIADNGAGGFRLGVRDGYASRDAYEWHVAALRDACRDRPLAAELFLLLGAIEHDRASWREAARALDTWHDIVPGQRHAGAMELRRYAHEQAR